MGESAGRKAIIAGAECDRERREDEEQHGPGQSARAHVPSNRRPIISVPAGKRSGHREASAEPDDELACVTI